MINNKGGIRMGAWGSGLYADDSTCDVRDSYIRYLSVKYMLIQKIGEGIEESSNEPMMRIQVMDRIFDELSTLEEVTGVRILPLDFPKRVDMSEEPVWMSAYIFMFKKSEYLEK